MIKTLFIALALMLTVTLGFAQAEPPPSTGIYVLAKGAQIFIFTNGGMLSETTPVETIVSKILDQLDDDQTAMFAKAHKLGDEWKEAIAVVHKMNGMIALVLPKDLTYKADNIDAYNADKENNGWED